jgi:hypothetical protein
MVCIGVEWSEDSSLEKRLHKKFSHLRIRGEWFDGECGTIERYIVKINDQVENQEK